MTANLPDAPTPPDTLSANIVTALAAADIDELRAAATYAADLADWREQMTEPESDMERDRDREIDNSPDGWATDNWEEAVREAADNADIPLSKGTVTEKTINDNDYYYLQWREGEQVRSQYIGSVDPSE